MMSWATAAVLTVASLTPGPGLPDRDQIMAVPSELQAQLQDHVIQASLSKQRRFELLIDFVSNDQRGLTLEYNGASTGTVEETFRSGEANCLSFTLLFVALAREAGLHAQLQEIDQVLWWFRQDGVVYNAGHVNARVLVGGQWRTVDVSGDAVIARDKPRVISDQRALAYFYNNRGAELMAAGDRLAAGRHLDAALAIDPDNASVWNNIGVLSLRNGNHRAAERAYTNALKSNANNAAALSNLVTLYQRSGDQAQAARFLRRLQEAQLADPFHQFLLAMEHEKRGDYANAARDYRRAIRLHGNEHVFHFNLARVYLLMGDARRARRALARAYALSDDSTRKLYQAKVDSLQRPAKAMEASTPARVSGPE